MKYDLPRSISFSNDKSADDLFISLSSQGIDKSKIIRYDRMLVFYDEEIYKLAVLLR